MKRLTYSLILMFTAAACSRQDSTLNPQKESITESVYAAGVIKSAEQYQVFSGGSGLLEHVYVKEGDTVPAGGLLFSVNSELSKLNRDNAELASEYADFENNSQKLREAAINLETAAKKMKLDSILLQRQRNLWQQNIGSKLELEQKELAYSNSLSTFQAAEIRLRDLERQLKFSARQSRKNLEISSSLFNDFRIFSKINGRVYSILKKEGEMISPQMPLALLGSASQFYAELQIDEYDASSVKPGMTVFLTLDSYRDSVFEARITKIYPLMNERSKTFTAEAEFIRKPQLLYPNMSLEASIVLKRKTGVLTIPRNYLIGDSAVMLEGGAIRKVRTGLKDFRKAEIVSGLKEGDALILPEE